MAFIGELHIHLSGGDLVFDAHVDAVIIDQQPIRVGEDTGHRGNNLGLGNADAHEHQHGKEQEYGNALVHEKTSKVCVFAL
jgi:hypothetical protein